MSSRKPRFSAVKPKFSIGYEVSKPEVYPFPGTVQAVFTRRDGEVRFVVEHDCGGLLHIFNDLQLMKGRKP